MNKKDKIVFIIWVALCLLIIGFMIFHVIRTQINAVNGKEFVQILKIGGLFK